ncbi:ABC transporter substrate-binding protein [Rhizobium sp. 007]|uniref:ABC transporter substrate-binding protein n=1 Tax=Rhizobium sp. 007 TaxID=2785056 RepID=UPI00188F4C8B|nr:ABC transporter substrate-binding protein [Rhizobium sp. 007]QPB24704.1 ABC transporter substrate-binding protein [Rhizobium sp. 007]
MTISRREFFKVSLAAGAALSTPSVLRSKAAAAEPLTIRMVRDNLKVYDPIWTTSGVTANHGAAIYDTLFALDSKFMPQPQMVGNWGVSEDKRTYTFELRDGLAWHDGTPVTAADCVASLRRWAKVHPGGKLIMARARDISAKDQRTFIIALNEPLSLLINILGDVTAPLPFMMREKDAELPATEQVTSNIGSGPFKFNKDLARPGASFTYDRNDQYVPRQEASDGLAGGKIVNVDHVVWNIISDQQTALAALQAGEVDLLDSPAVDLLSVIDADPNLEVRDLNQGGLNNVLRMNFLQPPFNNVKARQALLHLIDQEAFLNILFPDPRFRSTVTSIFGHSTLYTNDANTGWFKKGGDPEKAKQLFKEAGYVGEKVLILQPTDLGLAASSACQLLADTLRKVGVNAELASMAWGELATRRSNKGPVDNGGWSLFISDQSDYALGNPIGSPFLVASGDDAWYGWPKSDEYEALRAKWADVETLDQRKDLARQMQTVWWDFVGDMRLGQNSQPIAYRKALTGLIGMPQILPMWNLRKA